MGVNGKLPIPTPTGGPVPTFCAFCATVKTPETRQPNIFTTHIILDEDDDDSFQPKDPAEPLPQDSYQEKPQDNLGDLAAVPQTTLIDLGPRTHVIPEDQEPMSLDPHDELLRWHYQLGHLHFDCIKQLAEQGQLPKHLLACKKPFCATCQYGKMTKQPWRVKGDNKGTTKMATQPGQIVSVDQLESNSPGFVAQLKGILMQQHYKYTTIFVDEYTFIYLQKCITSEETVMAKHALEHSVEQCGMKICHYHIDNGQFADNAFIADCNMKQQSLSYCGVNAHFKNGIAECHIRDLQEQTRTSMLYAMNKWNKMVLICLWPYAMRHTNDVTNVTPRKGEELSPLEKFSGVQVTPKL